MAPRGLLVTIARVFDEEGWTYEEDEENDEQLLVLGFTGENGSFPCHAKQRQGREQVLFYCHSRVKTPEARRTAMAELLARANYGLVIGNFELDFDDGEVRYKTSLDVTGGELSPTLARNMIVPAIATMDRYLGAIMRCMTSLAAPSALVDWAEGAAPEPPADPDGA